jgi:hypothetical protein
VFSTITEPHFIAHVFTHDEAMDFAKALTNAALNAKPRSKK